ncbi:ferritin-like domain-containing protein [uncultured Algimonas sp.]|uniref:YciE/YciF ferroxidase family protein n=1 Tax=uncultured Algimonas sp. TaxID=1547920 RepID=UPI002606B816|nr:ferritin-like domain-containing protein [uncultured Algimonas sp.]
MAINNLKELYLAELKDLYDANEQANATIEKLIPAASDSGLKDALKQSITGTKKGNEHLKSILDSHGEGVGNVTCKGMKGLTKEAEEHVLKEEYGDDSVRDAMLISQYQRMAHYAITGYGSVEAFAKRLDLLEDAKKLETCKEETMEGDLKFTKLAQDGINKAAKAA